MSDKIAVLVIAGQHSFSGMVDHHNQRVLDVLNDSSSEFLRIYGDEGESVVPKAAIEVVVLLEQYHEAPLRRQYAYIEKQPHCVKIVLTDREVRGSLLTKSGRSDPVWTLGREASTFFPVTQASVSGTDLPASVVLLNKAKVSLFQMQPSAKGVNDPQQRMPAMHEHDTQACLLP